MEEVETHNFNELKKIDNCYRFSIKNSIDEEFGNLRGITYVDHAAAGLYSKKQLLSIFNVLNSSVFGNPHSRHLPSDAVTQAIDATRNRILKHFNSSNEDYDLIFTFGATDAIKIVANNFCWSDEPSHLLANGKQHLKKELIGSSFVYTQENHTSVLGIRELASKHGANIYPLLADEVFNLLRQSESNHFSTYVANEDPVSHVGLFAYPGQCNFSGTKYPLRWIEEIHNGKLNNLLKKRALYINGKVEENSIQASKTKWFVLLDAASLVATSPLDLRIYKPDFVPISFYKMFGYPTGLGCLLVSKRAGNYMHKSYFGGGTVQMVDATTMVVSPRIALHERFEDGTLPFLNILALEHGFNTLIRIAGSMKCIEDHVFNIAYYLYCNMKSMRHSNHKEVMKIYSDNEIWTKDSQGPIVNFNIMDSCGNYVGFTHVERVASLYNIYLRTGCVCNPGACQKFLQISSLKLKQQHQAGHICGDAIDIVDGYPTGSVRVSFGYMSTFGDADMILKMIKECFVDGQIIYDKSWYNSGSIREFQLNNVNMDNLRSSDTNILINPSHEVCIESCSKRLVIEEKKCKISNDLKKSPYRLVSIIIYPVKSCSGVMVPKWSLGNCGLEFDRQWMIVTSSGITLTSKKVPHMCLIKPFINFHENVLELTYKGKGFVSVDLSINSNKGDQEVKFCGGRVCGDRVKGLDCGDYVGEWLSNVLEIKDLRLIKQAQGRKNRLSYEVDTSGGAAGGDASFRRSQKIDGATKNVLVSVLCKKVGKLSLANESQYLIILEASIQHLFRQIKERGIENALTEDDLKLRFRPNLIIRGGSFYEEDLWDSISIGTNIFKIHGSCTRCLTVCVDSETGEKTKEPLLTLAATRGTNMKFGVHASYLDDSLSKYHNVIEANMVVSVKKKVQLDH